MFIRKDAEKKKRKMKHQNGKEREGKKGIREKEIVKGCY
jgi:hypothetical protein